MPPQVNVIVSPFAAVIASGVVGIFQLTAMFLAHALVATSAAVAMKRRRDMVVVWSWGRSCGGQSMGSGRVEGGWGVVVGAVLGHMIRTA